MKKKVDLDNLRYVKIGRESSIEDADEVYENGWFWTSAGVTKNLPANASRGILQNMVSNAVKIQVWFAWLGLGEIYQRNQQGSTWMEWKKVAFA
ncbi:MAG: hypothetical protein J1E16_04195 [Muribaculaceae bacterium]|nr:hypothetical protein [Muribaculaceae bacterium]